MHTERVTVALLLAITLVVTGCQVAPVARPAPPGEKERAPEEVAPGKPSPAAAALRDEAKSQLEAGDTELASANLERAIRIDPSFAGGYFELARVRVIEGLDEQARQLLLEALDLLDSQGIRAGDLLKAVNRLLDQLTISDSRQQNGARAH